MLIRWWNVNIFIESIFIIIIEGFVIIKIEMMGNEREDKEMCGGRGF